MFATSDQNIEATAATAGFTATDYAWEQVQESALRAFQAGAAATAAKHWQRGLAIARSHFDPSDPRLATSLTNYALVMRRQGDAFQARRHFRDALQAWELGPRWVRLMAPAIRPDACYDETAIATFQALLAEGRDAAAAIERYDLLPEDGLERWREERPGRGSDLRKLLAAVLLLASGRD